MQRYTVIQHHTRMYNSEHIQRKQTYILALIMLIISHETVHIQLQRWNQSGLLIFLMKSLPRNQLRRCNVPPNHRPACSSISQQHFHPRARHDSSRTKGQCRLTHSQGFPTSQTHTVGFYQITKELGQAKFQAGGLNTSLLMHTQPLIPLTTLRRPTTAYCSKTTHSQLCEEGKDNRVTIPNKRWNTVHVHKTTQGCSWTQHGQNNSTATQNQGTSTATNSQ